MPLPRIEARFGLEDFHDRPGRLVEVLESLYVPVAVSLREVPFAILAFAGVIAIETK